MGKGIDMARVNAPEHAALIDEFKDQLLIIFLKRLKQEYGDSLVFTVAETDDTGQDLLAFKIVEGCFHFTLQKKE
jgi:hypothetical protein